MRATYFTIGMKILYKFRIPSREPVVFYGVIVEHERLWKQKVKKPLYE